MILAFLPCKYVTLPLQGYAFCLLSTSDGPGAPGADYQIRTMVDLFKENFAIVNLPVRSPYT
jgi:hypothetical protein